MKILTQTLQFIMLIISIFSTHIYADTNISYYYADNRKIAIKELDSKFLVRMANTDETIDGMLSRHGYSSEGLTEKVINLKEYLFVEYSGPSTVCDSFIENSKGNDAVSFVSKKYVTSNDIEIGLTNEILVVFKDNTSEKNKAALYEKYGVDLIESTTYDLVKVPKNADVLKIANSIHENEKVKFAEPNFLCEYEQHGDTYFDAYLQFPLDNYGYNGGTVDADVDASLAWGITTGSSDIVVAVIDDGIEDHVDIPSNKLEIINGSNFGPDSSENDPSPLSGNKHGQSCAGIIIAQHNSLGIRGIAPGCKIMPVRMGPFPSSSSALISLAVNVITFAYQNGADVISGSWGGFPSSSSIQQAISNATTYGRNGKGTVVCFSAGNSGNDYEIDAPAKYCNSVAGALCVGATTKNDTLAPYSQAGDLDMFPEYCWRVTVAAPSSATMAGEVYTTDRDGSLGYNPSGGVYTPNWGSNYADFTGKFGGTSAATPLVAGIAALILSVDSTLTASEVEGFITSSAEKLSGFTFETSGAHVGMNNEIGYGRVNAYAALQAAQSANKTVSVDNRIRVKQASVSISPNPANPATTIHYSIVQPGNVKLAVYNANGQKVATLVNDYMHAGTHSAMFDGANLASGVYFYRLEAKGFAKSGKMLLIK